MPETGRRRQTLKCPVCQRQIEVESGNLTLCIECNLWTHFDCFSEKHDICLRCCQIGTEVGEK